MQLRRDGRLTDRERQRLREAYTKVPVWEQEQPPRRHSLLATKSRCGWCERCREFSVKRVNGKTRCQRCGGGLARGFEMVEAAGSDDTPECSPEEFRFAVEWALANLKIALSELSEVAGLSDGALGSWWRGEVAVPSQKTMRRVLRAIGDITERQGVSSNG